MMIYFNMQTQVAQACHTSESKNPNLIFTEYKDDDK